MHTKYIGKMSDLVEKCKSKTVLLVGINISGMDVVSFLVRDPSIKIIACGKHRITDPSASNAFEETQKVG